MVFAWKWDTSISNGLWSVSHFSTDYSWGKKTIFRHGHSSHSIFVHYSQKDLSDPHEIPIRFPLLVIPALKIIQNPMIPMGITLTNLFIYSLYSGFTLHIPSSRHIHQCTRVGINRTYSHSYSHDIHRIVPWFFHDFPVIIHYQHKVKTLYRQRSWCANVPATYS